MMDAATLPLPQNSTNHMESHGDYSWVVTSSPRFRVVVCKDRWQWIIQRRSGIRRGGSYWKSVSYHRDRDSLKRRWRRLVSAREGCKELELLPQYFGLNTSELEDIIMELQKAEADKYGEEEEYKQPESNILKE